MPFKKYRTLIEIIFLWAFPIVTMVLLYGEFADKFSPTISAFMLLFPALTMYLVVGTGAGYCKFWYFTTSCSIANVTLSIGFIYSSVINLSAYLALPYVPLQSLNFIFFVGIGTAISAIFIDIFLLGSGLFYLKSKKYPLGSNPVKHAISYGSWFFTVVGMWNAFGIYLGYGLITKNQFNWVVLLLLLPVIFALPFAIRFISQKNKLKKMNLVYGE